MGESNWYDGRQEVHDGQGCRYEHDIEADTMKNPICACRFIYRPFPQGLRCLAAPLRSTFLTKPYGRFGTCQTGCSVMRGHWRYRPCKVQLPTFWRAISTGSSIAVQHEETTLQPNLQVQRSPVERQAEEKFSEEADALSSRDKERRQSGHARQTDLKGQAPILG